MTDFKYNLSTKKDIESLQKKVKYIYSKISGKTSGEEDCAQDVFLNIITNPQRISSIDQMVIDHLRSKSGDKRYICYTHGFNLESSRNNGGEFIEYLKTSDMDNLSESELIRIADKTKTKMHRAIILLYYFWGFETNEIAKLFGVTSSWISQEHKKICKYLNRYLK